MINNISLSSSTFSRAITNIQLYNSHFYSFDTFPLYFYSTRKTIKINRNFILLIVSSLKTLNYHSGVYFMFYLIGAGDTLRNSRYRSRIKRKNMWLKLKYNKIIYILQNGIMSQGLYEDITDYNTHSISSPPCKEN